MRGQPDELHELARLSGLDGEALRVTFRRAFANLAQATSKRALPLEGLDPEQLRAGIEAALAAGLFEDLSWLAAPSAASALYELVSTLPPCPARDALNRGDQLPPPSFSSSVEPRPTCAAARRGKTTTGRAAPRHRRRARRANAQGSDRKSRRP